MTEGKLERKREIDRKYRWRQKFRKENIEYDDSLDSQELKELYYTITQKIPKEKKSKPIKTEGDHTSDQFYSALEEIKKEEEAENLHIRSNLPEGVSSLIRGRGGDVVPLKVINDSRINIEHYLSERKKGKKDKDQRKSSWRI